MTLDETIIKAKHNSIKENLPETIQKLSTVDRFVENQKQLAEWLEELKELRVLLEKAEADVFEYMHQAEKAEQKGYNKALEDVENVLNSMVKKHIKWCESDEEYVDYYYTDRLYYSDIEEIVEKLKAGGKE